MASTDKQHQNSSNKQKKPGARSRKREGGISEANKQKIEKIMAVTGWPAEEDVYRVLQECSFNLELAIDKIFSGDAGRPGEEWTEVTSRRKPKDTKPSAPADNKKTQQNQRPGGGQRSGPGGPRHNRSEGQNGRGDSRRRDPRPQFGAGAPGQRPRFPGAGGRPAEGQAGANSPTGDGVVASPFGKQGQQANAQNVGGAIGGGVQQQQPLYSSYQGQGAIKQAVPGQQQAQTAPQTQQQHGVKAEQGAATQQNTNQAQQSPTQQTAGATAGQAPSPSLQGQPHNKAAAHLKGGPASRGGSHAAANTTRAWKPVQKDTAATTPISQQQPTPAATQQANTMPSQQPVGAPAAKQSPVTSSAVGQQPLSNGVSAQQQSQSQPEQQQPPVRTSPMSSLPQAPITFAGIFGDREEETEVHFQFGNLGISADMQHPSSSSESSSHTATRSQIARPQPSSSPAPSSAAAAVAAAAQNKEGNISPVASLRKDSEPVTSATKQEAAAPQQQQQEARKQPDASSAAPSSAAAASPQQSQQQSSASSQQQSTAARPSAQQPLSQPEKRAPTPTSSSTSASSLQQPSQQYQYQHQYQQLQQQQPQQRSHYATSATAAMQYDSQVVADRDSDLAAGASHMHLKMHGFPAYAPTSYLPPHAMQSFDMSDAHMLQLGPGFYDPTQLQQTYQQASHYRTSSPVSPDSSGKFSSLQSSPPGSGGAPTGASHQSSYSSSAASKYGSSGADGSSQQTPSSPPTSASSLHQQQQVPPLAAYTQYPPMGYYPPYALPNQYTGYPAATTSQFPPFQRMPPYPSPYAPTKAHTHGYPPMNPAAAASGYTVSPPSSYSTEDDYAKQQYLPQPHLASFYQPTMDTSALASASSSAASTSSTASQSNSATASQQQPVTKSGQYGSQYADLSSSPSSSSASTASGSYKAHQQHHHLQQQQHLDYAAAGGDLRATSSYYNAAAQAPFATQAYGGQGQFAFMHQQPMAHMMQQQQQQGRQMPGGATQPSQYSS
ncbi:Circumsporozoite protein [Balamuthia mandrillaris]